MDKPFVSRTGRMAEFTLTALKRNEEGLLTFRLYADRDDLFDAAKNIEGTLLEVLADRSTGYLTFEVKPYYDAYRVYKCFYDTLTALAKTEDIPF